MSLNNDQLKAVEKLFDNLSLEQVEQLCNSIDAVIAHRFGAVEVVIKSGHPHLIRVSYEGPLAGVQLRGREK